MQATVTSVDVINYLTSIYRYGMFVDHMAPLEDKVVTVLSHGCHSLVTWLSQGCVYIIQPHDQVCTIWYHVSFQIGNPLNFLMYLYAEEPCPIGCAGIFGKTDLVLYLLEEGAKVRGVEFHEIIKEGHE